MSEEFEGVSIDVSADGSAPEVAPVGGGTEAPVVVPVDASSPVSEQPDADQRVFDNNTKIGSAEDNIRQDVAAENGTALGNGGGEGRAPVTERGKEDAENKKQERQAQILEADEQRSAEAKRRDDWLNKSDHQFGNMTMSGHDLARMIDFIKDPEKQKELRGRLTGKFPKDKEKELIDKGMKELNDYIKLKEKEQKGELSPADKARLDAINKSEEFKVVAQESVNLGNSQGLNINVSKNEALANKAVSLQGASTSNVDDLVSQRIETPVVSEQTKSQNPVSWSAASSRDELPKTVALTSTYNDKSFGLVAANTSEPVIKPQVAANVQMPATVSVAKIEASNNAFM